mmetsp:Transcript_15401/g.17145  ORF Transcript_15401/g.17145 Transcript_15401/m.17145 type:complete len:315 (-) Transcript_15401:42-986(-)
MLVSVSIGVVGLVVLYGFTVLIRSFFCKKKKKIPEVILRVRRREAARKKKKEESQKRILANGLGYDPSSKELSSVKKFKVVQSNTYCLFAKKAVVWGSNDWQTDLTLEENVKRSVPAILKFFMTGYSARLDGFVIEVQGKEYSDTVEHMGETTRRVLTAVSVEDPAGNAVMDNPNIERRGWRYSFNDENIFVTTFGLCYPDTHGRYAHGAGKETDSCFVLFQPEFSFGLHGLGPDHPWDDTKKTIRQKIRYNFRDHGQLYYVPPTRYYAMAPMIVPSLEVGGKPPSWWVKPEDKEKEDDNKVDSDVVERSVVQK